MRASGNFILRNNSIKATLKTSIFYLLI